MEEPDFSAFSELFREAYYRGFGEAFVTPLSETESKILANKVLEQTGLTIGWKSIKNYSLFITDKTGSRQENPSTATLDTFARYVLGAPHITELQRRSDENHYPYWFLYREKFLAKSEPAGLRKLINPRVVVIAIIAIACLAVAYYKFISVSPEQYTDNFHHTDGQSLKDNGWFLKSEDTTFWKRRNEKPDMLTLFTLRGDNWPDSSSKPEIKNLLLRKLPSGCFTVEVHFRDFIPDEEWQQAGLLLMEGTTFSSKSIRLSLAFNDNFGGRKMPSEIYLQVITALGDGFGKPEEIAHQAIFHPDSLRANPVLLRNLRYSALRIEKSGKQFRFLYSGGGRDDGAFREITEKTFDMKPKYVGLFALRGFTGSHSMPVYFQFFRIVSNACE